MSARHDRPSGYGPIKQRHGYRFDPTGASERKPAELQEEATRLQAAACDADSFGLSSLRMLLQRVIGCITSTSGQVALNPHPVLDQPFQSSSNSLRERLLVLASTALQQHVRRPKEAMDALRAYIDLVGRDPAEIGFACDLLEGQVEKERQENERDLETETALAQVQPPLPSMPAEGEHLEPEELEKLAEQEQRFLLGLQNQEGPSEPQPAAVDPDGNCAGLVIRAARDFVTFAQGQELKEQSFFDYCKGLIKAKQHELDDEAFRRSQFEQVIEAGREFGGKVREEVLTALETHPPAGKMRDWLKQFETPPDDADLDGVVI